MKKLVITCMLIVSAITILAKPGSAPHHPALQRPGPSSHHCPPPPQHGHHNHHGHHNDWWIGPAIVGRAILGSTIVNTVTQPNTIIVQQPPTIVTQPTVVHQPVKVWVAGYYTNQVQPNGVVVRVWHPGHWEWR